MNNINGLRLWKSFSNNISIINRKQNTFYSINTSIIRTLLSPSYSCPHEWENRLNNELLKKISAESFFNELNQRFMKKLTVSAVDVDLFANVVTHVEQLEELQSILYRFRRTRKTVDTLESSHHSVCRAFLQFRQSDRLIHILSDRVGFGIFPDFFTYNMILDYFIEEKDFRNGAKVATLMALQEDFGNEISKRLALYSVHMYLRDKNRIKLNDEEEDKSETKTEAPVDEDDDDIQYIRVPYLRREWFDDHFDIRNDIHLCGKTLYFFGKQFNDIVGRTYQLIGLVLYEKWDKSIELLKTFRYSLNENVILKEVMITVEEILANIPEDSDHKEKILEFKKILDEMNSQQKLVDQDLHELISGKLLEIKELESNDIKAFPEMLKEWENAREVALNKQINDILKEEKKKEILEKKKQLVEKKRYLYFFENFSKHEIDFVEAEKRIAELKSKTVVDEDYIPPEI